VKAHRLAEFHAPWETAAFAITSRLEHRLYQAQHPAVGYSLGHQREQFLLFNRPEKVLQIGVHDPLPSSIPRTTENSSSMKSNWAAPPPS
jgi:hypothetical protein